MKADDLEWIRAGLEKSGKTRSGLAAALKRAPSMATALLKGGRQLKASEVQAIADYLEVEPPAHLLAPELTRVPLGEEFNADPDPDEPLTLGSETGRRGTPEDGSAQLDVTAGMGAGGLTIVSDGVPGKHGMTFAAEHVRDYWRLPPQVLAALGLRAPDVTIIPVQGDSMETTLSEGDFVFVDTRHRIPSPDGVYALSDEFGGIVVKRLEMASGPRSEDPIVRIISDNPRHAPKERPLSDVYIIGRVLRRFGVVR
jgi:hypothetical protein